MLLRQYFKLEKSKINRESVIHVTLKMGTRSKEIVICLLWNPFNIWFLLTNEMNCDKNI